MTLVKASGWSQRERLIEARRRQNRYTLRAMRIAV